MITLLYTTVASIRTSDSPYCAATFHEQSESNCLDQIYIKTRTIDYWFPQLNGIKSDQNPVMAFYIPNM